VPVRFRPEAPTDIQTFTTFHKKTPPGLAPRGFLLQITPECHMQRARRVLRGKAISLIIAHACTQPLSVEIQGTRAMSTLLGAFDHWLENDFSRFAPDLPSRPSKL
jgi:hypothetical protein